MENRRFKEKFTTKRGSEPVNVGSVTGGVGPVPQTQLRENIGRVQQVGPAGTIARADTCDEAVQTNSKPPGDGEIVAAHARKSVSRGRGSGLSPPKMKDEIQFNLLLLVSRFRYLRTIDIALGCFSGRTFSAAQSAAHRAVRGALEQKLISRHRTRFGTSVYALTQHGANLLWESGASGIASNRHADDLQNREHGLWCGFVALLARARGLDAETESEFLTNFGKSRSDGIVPIRTSRRDGSHQEKWLRPDVVSFSREATFSLEEENSLTWYEIDYSRRGAERCSDLRLLLARIGTVTKVRHATLRRVVVWAATQRIFQTVMSAVERLCTPRKPELDQGKVGLVKVPSVPGLYNVWVARIEAPTMRIVSSREGEFFVGLLPENLARGHRPEPGPWFQPTWPYPAAWPQKLFDLFPAE